MRRAFALTVMSLLLACSQGEDSGPGGDQNLGPGSGGSTTLPGGKDPELGSGGSTTLPGGKDPELGSGGSTTLPGGEDPEPGPGTTAPGLGDQFLEPGSQVTTVLPADRQEELDRLSAVITAAGELTTEEFLAARAVPFATTLPYHPGDAAHLDLIQASPLALGTAELARLDERGFVISDRQLFPTVAAGLEAIYAADLPVFVSADTILEAVHRSYDDVLKAVEEYSLHGELLAMLDAMRASLAAGGAAELGEQARKDADLYLAVAHGLLAQAASPPVAGADAAAIAALRSGAEAADGWQEVELFGVAREVDFSQFTPRGHYTDSPLLARYFRATIWLGRIDFRLLETQPDGSQVFHRRQLEGALALRSLAQGAARTSWERIDRAIAVFVGEPDNMTLPELDRLLADLGVADASGLAAISDEAIAGAIVAGGYGTQRISSHIMINGLDGATLPLSSTFLLLGQSYVVDSHVFSNVVYDRVRGGAAKRMLPDPLDAAYAVFGNDQATALLASELERWSYAPDLEAMRILVDAHPAAFWESSLYGLWLRALRAVSPDRDEIADLTSGLPSVARTEAWGRRLANTQLASWAELRHDTILYAKQSYTMGATCEFPDAYVDPYPEFYETLHAYAQRGRTLVGTLLLDVGLATRIDSYFAELSEVSARLADMARRQRTGAPFTEEQLAWINELVRIQRGGCGGDPTGMEGWYARLHFNPFSGLEYDPTIADVHTQPTDEVGNSVGRVLHVGTGLPRLLVITADTCAGPKAYVGVASSYFEEVTENFERLDDPTWAQRLWYGNPADVRWLQDLVVR